jgi:hypothetical protein
MTKKDLQVLFFDEISREQIINGINQCNNLEIDNDDQLVSADDLISKLRFYLKQIQTRKKALIKPYKDKIDEIKDFSSGIESSLDNASRKLTRKKSSYLKEKEEQQKKELLEKADDIESVLSSAKTMIQKPEPVVRAIRKYKVPVIVEYDIKKIPDEYLILNESKIKKDFKAGKKIPGVKIIYEEREAGT